MNVQWVYPIHIRHSEIADNAILYDGSVLPEDAVILAVNGKQCIGRCGGCGKPVLAESTYTTDESVGRLVCGECLRELDLVASMYDDREAKK